MLRLLALFIVVFLMLFDLNAVSVNAGTFPSSSLFGFPSMKPFPFPTKTPTPTGTPTPSSAPSATPTPTPSTKFELLNAKPSSANFMQEFVLTGNNFGTTQGSVNFRYFSNSYSSGGATIISWTNNEIHAKVPALAKGSYRIQVVTSDNKKSNEIVFKILNGQPLVNSTSLTINNGVYALTFQGKELGKKGSIDIYNGSTLVNHGIIKSWSSSKITFTVPTLSHQQYGFQVTTSDARQSSLMFFTVGN